MRCIHCLTETEKITKDHVFPQSWFPDSTPQEVQHWTAPSCKVCNNRLSKDEEDLFTRLALTVDPNALESSGIGERALRSYGVRTTGLSTKEREIRERRRQKILKEMNDFSGTAHLVPGANPILLTKDGRLPPPIPIKGEVLSSVYIKIMKGCEYVLGNRRYVEPPYQIEVYDNRVLDVFTSIFGRLPPTTTLGPGFSIKRGFAEDEPLSVMYEITFWGIKKILGIIVLPEEK